LTFTGLPQQPLLAVIWLALQHAHRERSFKGPVLMYMFLPFLRAFAACASASRSRAGLGYLFWGATVVVTVAWFFHHTTDSLNLSF
jgi:Family of unknown function (DUF5993)